MRAFSVPLLLLCSSDLHKMARCLDLSTSKRVSIPEQRKCLRLMRCGDYLNTCDWKVQMTRLLSTAVLHRF